MINQIRKILSHPDLEIDLVRDKNGKDSYVGLSKKYEPFTASAGSAYDCFFKFNIQLAEQKVISAFMLVA
ncbi:MAG: hypothetical protein K0Q66_565 [Chitinophagaceae bacterium]|jgi:hypothetical protein|nr:hypothetical protein [Chitinophagaceae bacterium]